MIYTCWFTDETAGDLSLVGGKGANLGRMAAAGFPVPPGFCVTASAYRYLLNVTGLNPVLSAMVQRIDFNDPLNVAASAAEIRELIEQQPIPTAVAAEILENYFKLGREMDFKHLEITPVAVRSSATAEDQPDASFAGQHDTYLNVRGGTSLLEHVRRCWASLWSDRAVTYRHQQGYDHQNQSISVVVQAMINPQVSGILFTANPLNGRLNESVINASWGLGEAIVSGIVTPDTYVIDKREGRIIHQEIARKERRIVYDSFAGTVEQEVPQPQSRQSSLTPQQIDQLAALVSRIEEFYDAPQDVEWALQDNDLYILQARPVTTLKQKQRLTERDGSFSRAMFVEIFPDGLSPSFLSVVSALLADMMRVSFRTLGFSKRPHRQAVAEFLNQPYLSIDYIEEVLGEIGPRDRALLVARFSNIFDQEEENQRLSLTQLKIALNLMRFTRRFKHEIPALLAAYHDEIDRIKALRLHEMTDAELLARVRHISFVGAGPLLNNDFLLIAAISVHRRLLESVLRPAYGDRSADLVNNLLSGVCGNVIMQTNNLIWELALVARAQPEVRRTIQENSPSDALRELRNLPQTEPFLEQLGRVLEECGHREQRFDICYPTWGEDPAPVLAFVRSYLDVEMTAAPAQREAGLTAQRQALTREVYAALGASVSGRLLLLPLFKYLLPQTQWLVRERDTMHYEWTRLFPPVRRMQLEVGRRWKEMNLIEQPEDIFFLTLSEQEEIARLSRPCFKLIGERKAAYQANVAGPWPEVIIDGFALHSGQEAPPIADLSYTDDGESLDALAGVGGSPGCASGPARIILGPHDFHRLRQGEILVAPMTNPSWTPLFAIAGGIITEVGGVLSHGAIVAREYGIPAVLSAQGITGVLADGETVTVDGDRGLIRREPLHTRSAHTIAGNHTIMTNQSTAT